MNGKMNTRKRCVPRPLAAVPPCSALSTATVFVTHCADAALVSPVARALRCLHGVTNAPLFRAGFRVAAGVGRAPWLPGSELRLFLT